MVLGEAALDDQLDTLEHTELCKGVDRLEAALKGYPIHNSVLHENDVRWAKTDRWAANAMDPTYHVLSQLGLVQTRSAKTRNAFISALTAYDRLLGIVENRNPHQSLEDYATAKLAIQTCIEHTRRLL